jgi:hypothetical protein
MQQIINSISNLNSKMSTVHGDCIARRLGSVDDKWSGTAEFSYRSLYPCFLKFFKQGFRALFTFEILEIGDPY